jgi:hypothetical protein
LDKQIQQPITLVLPVAADRLQELKATVACLDVAKLTRALDTVGTVHNTRFVIVEDPRHGSVTLMLVAIFDGPLDEYIRAFARLMADEFNVLLAFAENRPPELDGGVERDVDAFVRYVEENNVPPANATTYSAYPDLTALDIYEASRPHDPAPPALDPRR